MASKFEILAALIDARADRDGDEMGWHYVLQGVLHDLHDYQNAAFEEDRLAEIIYERLADSVSIESFDPAPAPDRPLAPGELDTDTGRYNAATE